MGSYLMSCGVSNRVLKEGTPVSLFFIAHKILDRDGNLAEVDCFKTWKPENLVIQGVQDDYGHVEVDEEHQDKMIEIMVNAALNSAESPSSNEYHPSWKQYFDKNMKNYDKMDNDQIQEHFNAFLHRLQSYGIVYKSNVQGTTSILKVAHVDQIVVDTVLETPLYGDNFYLDYSGGRCSRYVLKNFEDFIDYLVLSNKKSFEECLENKYASLRVIGDDSTNYDALLRNPYLEDRDSLDNIINFAIDERRDALMFRYFDMMNIKITPSEYASQDYSEFASSNYRNVMSKVFEKQKKKLMADNIESRWENGEALDGGELSEDITLDDAMKEMDKLIELPEVVISDSNVVVTSDAVNWQFLQSYKKTKNKLKP